MTTSDKTRAGRAVTVRRRLCRPQHQSAPRRALGRPRSFRHRGRGRRDRLRPHAQELSEREVAEAPVQPAVRRHHHARSRRQRVRHLAEGHGEPHRRSMSRTTARRTRATSTMSRCAPCARTRWRSSIATCSSLRRRTSRSAGDRNHYLTDGHVTLVIMPWDITDYDGTGIITAGMDHIGFKVESVEAFKETSSASPPTIRALRRRR